MRMLHAALGAIVICLAVAGVYVLSDIATKARRANEEVDYLEIVYEQLATARAAAERKDTAKAYRAYGSIAQLVNQREDLFHGTPWIMAECQDYMNKHRHSVELSDRLKSLNDRKQLVAKAKALPGVILPVTAQSIEAAMHDACKLAEECKEFIRAHAGSYDDVADAQSKAMRVCTTLGQLRDIVDAHSRSSKASRRSVSLDLRYKDNGPDEKSIESEFAKFATDFVEIINRLNQLSVHTEALYTHTRSKIAIKTITASGYNVDRTNSLTSPYVGQITLSTVEVGRITVMFAYQNEQWVMKSIDTSSSRVVVDESVFASVVTLLGKRLGTN